MDQLFVKEEGSGPPLLLLHGFLEDHSVWREMVDELSSSFTLIMPDLPGHGRSGTVSSSGSMADMARLVIESIDRKEKKIDIAGHSMGGYVALEILRRYPERVNRLGLLFSTTDADSPERRVERDRAKEVYKRSPKMFAREAIPNLFYEKNRSRLQLRIDEMIEVAASHDPQGISAAIKGMQGRQSYTGVIRDMATKILIIGGEHDTVVPKKRLEEFAKDRDNIELHILSMSAHMGIIEEPMVVGKIMKDYFG